MIASFKNFSFLTVRPQLGIHKKMDKFRHELKPKLGKCSWLNLFPSSGRTGKGHNPVTGSVSTPG